MRSLRRLSASAVDGGVWRVGVAVNGSVLVDGLRVEGTLPSVSMEVVGALSGVELIGVNVGEVRMYADGGVGGEVVGSVKDVGGVYRWGVGEGEDAGASRVVFVEGSSVLSRMLSQVSLNVSLSGGGASDSGGVVGDGEGGSGSGMSSGTSRCGFGEVYVNVGESDDVFGVSGEVDLGEVWSDVGVDVRVPRTVVSMKDEGGAEWGVLKMESVYLASESDVVGEGGVCEARRWFGGVSNMVRMGLEVGGWQSLLAGEVVDGLENGDARVLSFVSVGDGVDVSVEGSRVVVSEVLDVFSTSSSSGSSSSGSSSSGS